MTSGYYDVVQRYDALLIAGISERRITILRPAVGKFAKEHGVDAYDHLQELGLDDFIPVSYDRAARIARRHTAALARRYLQLRHRQ